MHSWILNSYSKNIFYDIATIMNKRHVRRQLNMEKRIKWKKNCN